MTTKTILRVLLIIAALAGVAGAADSDAKAIEQAVLNYVNAFYDVAPELIDESVSPKLQKLGYMPARDGSGMNETWMTFDQLRDLASRLNTGGMFDSETAPREVTILEHSDLIATVKLTAAWGVDYIHLTKASGRWMIINVIWESAPR